MKIIILFLITFLNLSPSKGQNLVIVDLENFEEMFHKLPIAKSTEDTLNLIREIVIKNGTETFKEYVKYKENQNNYKVELAYLNRLRTYPKYYASILKQAEIFKTKNLKRKVNNVYKRLQKSYPKAKIKPNYICVGFMDDGGKSFESGQYVGLELFACTEKADTSELVKNKNDFDYCKAASFDLIRMDELILHELVHLSQFKGDNNFLQNFKGTVSYIPLLGEGGAAFITDLLFNYKVTIGPGTFNSDQFKYCEQNKAKLWKDYKKIKDYITVHDE